MTGLEIAFFLRGFPLSAFHLLGSYISFGSVLSRLHSLRSAAILDGISYLFQEHYFESGSAVSLRVHNSSHCS